jgi:hypothetical protein
MLLADFVQIELLVGHVDNNSYRLQPILLGIAIRFCFDGGFTVAA